VTENSIRILTGKDIASTLQHQEIALIDLIKRAYLAHAQGDSSLPHSLFLRFPNDARNRIIALPGYLGEDFEVAGIKWIASFPGNITQQLARASAVLVLNDVHTGLPQTILEGSIISAKRTAASAALAAQTLHPEPTPQVGLIGCGVIQFEIVRFLLATRPELERLLVFDLDATRAAQFKERCRQLSDRLVVDLAQEKETVFTQAALVSLATTAGTPHILELPASTPGQHRTLLHISLRDIAPDIILAADNVVDDVDHVLREQTSVHLAEQRVGHRAFIRCTLAEEITGTASPRPQAEAPTIFSPFGLGVLDLAVAKFVAGQALAENKGHVIPDFLPGE
jgi:2,3-diaminopropionate biosynthesis protein SbnB